MLKPTGKIYRTPASTSQCPLVRSFASAAVKQSVMPSLVCLSSSSLTDNLYLHSRHLRFSPILVNSMAHHSQCARYAEATHQLYLKDGFVSIRLFDDNIGYSARFLYNLNPVPLIHRPSMVNVFFILPIFPRYINGHSRRLSYYSLINTNILHHR